MTYKTDPGRIGNHEPSLDSLHLQTTARPFLDDVAPTRPNNRRLSSIIGSTARRCRIVEQEPHQAPVASAIPTHISKAVPICTSTLDESWSLHSCPILLCDNDGTFHSPLASISLPIPFPDYSQHLQHQQHFSCPLPPHAAYSLNSSHLLSARGDSFESQTSQNMVKAVALVHPPRRLSPAASTFDINPLEEPAPSTFIKLCHCSLYLVKRSRQV